MRARWRVCAILSLAGVLVGGLPALGSIARVQRWMRPGAAPANTISRYIETNSSTVHYDLGCDRAGRKIYGAVALLYGMPVLVNGKYGASLFNGPNSTTTTIGTAAKQFVKGFYECSTSGAYMYVAFATSNYYSGTNYVTFGHGAAWADMVDDIAAYADSNGYSSRVYVRGGSDMEPSWNTDTTTRAWVDGYDSTNTKLMYDVGSADGCPQTGDGTQDGTCNNGWKQSDVLYVSWTASPAVPLPEIYATSGANAKQWQKVKLYGVVSEGRTMDIIGTLTQWNACQENGGCNGTNNTPSAGWQQLTDQLNSDPRTAETVAFSTDISWEK